MTINSQKKSNAASNVVLETSQRLPLLIISIGLLLFLIPKYHWPSIVVTSFGLFLLIQSFILRIEFTEKELIVLQLGRELRRFPFKSWLAWRLLLPKLPGLLYFREEASPHLLPILFDPITLENQLKLRVGALETPKKEGKKPY